jgi:hydroxyacylglutathione hydrolase
MLTVFPIPAFQDNYIWALHNTKFALLVDPGDPTPCRRYLESHDLQLIAILNTHHHSDHTGGNVELALQYKPRIIGPLMETIPACSEQVTDGDSLHIPELALQFQVIATPGHTQGHVSYYGTNRLFCGDTLFACGCGRLFEGTPGMMLDSLERLLHLPDTTQVFCAHEYTVSNIRFAKTVDSANRALLERETVETAKRRQGLPTLPSVLALEKATNPFLRCHEAALTQSAERYLKHKSRSTVETFAAIREMKDHFQ